MANIPGNDICSLQSLKGFWSLCTAGPAKTAGGGVNDDLMVSDPRFRT